MTRTGGPTADPADPAAGSSSSRGRRSAYAVQSHAPAEVIERDAHDFKNRVRDLALRCSSVRTIMCTAGSSTSLAVGENRRSLSKRDSGAAHPREGGGGWMLLAAGCWRWCLCGSNFTVIIFIFF